MIHLISWCVMSMHPANTQNGGSHAELKSVICTFIAGASADAHIHSRGNFNRGDGEHDTPRYAGRRGRMVLQKEGKYELCVPDPGAMSGVHERKRRHLLPTQSSLERRSTHGIHFILKAPRLPDTASEATTQLRFSRLRRRREIRKNPTLRGIVEAHRPETLKGR